MEENENMGVEAQEQEAIETQEVATSENETNEEETTETNEEEATNEEVDKQEKAFAKRLAKEKEKFEREAAKYRRVAERGAKENNLSLEEYLTALENEDKEAEKEALEHLPNNIKEDYLYGRQQKRNEKELNNLLEKYPEIQTPSDLPEGTIALYNKYSDKGMTLVEAYELLKPKAINKTQIEQEAIKKLQKNSKNSTGSLSEPAQQENSNINTMSSKDFEEYTQKALRGELKKS